MTAIPPHGWTDAVVMVVASSPAKIRIRRVLDANYHGPFISRLAAEL
jgi:hypothetical protein